MTLPATVALEDSGLSSMQPTWIRIAYAIEFLVASIAIYTAWSQIGGQGHLDLMPWYWKFLCGFALASTTVGFTAASVLHDHFWNHKSLVWLVASLALVALMGALTYHYHLLEPADEESGDVMTSSIAFPGIRT